MQWHLAHYCCEYALFLSKKWILAKTKCFASEYFKLKGEKLINKEHIFIFHVNFL